MLEWITDILYQNISYLPFVSFGLLMLAGFNIPISEDVVVIVSGIIAGSYPNEVNPFYVYLGIWLGAYIGDFVSYFLGYFLGDKIFKIKFISKWVKPSLLEKLSFYINSYGVFALMVGRFIPFGVRNALFLSCGLSKMKFSKFALTDGCASILSTGVSFTLSYFFGNIVLEWIKKFQVSLLIGVIILLVTFFLWRWFKKKEQA